MNPARKYLSSFTFAAPRTNKRPRSVVPCPFTRANSDDNVSRFVFGKDNSFLLMILVVLAIFPEGLGSGSSA
jgi:hypothetical protein